jgi:S-adenosylmethionine:tRNA-ribosyltransferase-isomerase (queuine synthetase)
MLPDDLAAAEPPEARGLARDGVRLLAAVGDRIEHATFTDLDRFLNPGDLLVVNTSATRAAAVDGDMHVDLAAAFGRHERGQHVRAVTLVEEVLFQRTVIDGHRAAAGADAHPRDRGLPTPRAQ